MSRAHEPAIRARVTPANPGQFFACCGLLELADRLWGGAEGWFEEGWFFLRPLALGGSEEHTLGALLRAVASAPVRQVDPADDCSSPVELPHPFSLRLDWWKDDRAGGKRLKVWAGSMRSVRIARAMQSVLDRPELHDEGLFDLGMVVYDPEEPAKKVEPYYFDARRGAVALPLDIGFSPNALQMPSTAHPAVELLCLVGLQRCRPKPAEPARVFDYYTWAVPLEARVAPPAACGLLAEVGGRGFRFENAFRSDQRKHKAFTPATPLERR